MPCKRSECRRKANYDRDFSSRLRQRDDNGEIYTVRYGSISEIRTKAAPVLARSDFANVYPQILLRICCEIR